MTKKFAYLSFGVLCLVAAYQLGASRAASSPLMSLGIAAMDHNGWVLDDLGQVWNVGAVSGGTWYRAVVHDPPMPLDQIAFWGAHAIVTVDGRGWYNGGGGWVDCGTYPGGPIAVEPESWGGVKGKYRAR